MSGRPLMWARLGIGLSAFSLLLVVVNIALALLNARSQAEANARQQVIADAPQYNAIGEAIVRSLDKVAAASNDQALIALMQRHGLKPSGPAPASPSR